MIRRPKGTRDLLPGETEVRGEVEEALREVCESWGYREISTPTFEHLELFEKKSGEEIVDEIYGFEDKGGRRVALRPEVTASVVRSYLQEMQARPKPIKLYYFSNCFRYEQPQAGRYREFWQFGTEILGGGTPELDAEAVALSDEIMGRIGLEYRLEVGHLGVLRALARELGVPEEERDRLLSLLDVGDREGVREVFGEDAEEAFAVLDVEGEADRALSELRDLLSSHEVDEELGDLEALVEELGRHGVVPVVDMGIARGLEYYTGTVFEAYAPGLGAQDQVLGGGSYELCSVFGGEEMRSTGFAFGFDRLVEALGGQGSAPGPGGPPVYVAPVSESVRSYALQVGRRLRREGLRVEVDSTGRGIGAQISHADSRGVEWLVIVGERERDSGTVSLKDMETGEQETVEREDLPGRLD